MEDYGRAIIMIEELEKRFGQRFDLNDRALAAALLTAKEAVAAALSAAKEAVDKAEVAANKRFESVNEFREQLSDQASTFLSRELYEAQHGDLIKQVQRLNARMDTEAGRMAGSGVERRLENIRQQIDGNTAQLVRSGGMRESSKAAVAYAMAGLTVALNIVFFISIHYKK